eukprot:SM000034S12766  [mRNA]  locus=s34:663117:667662:+ [translate_table: standard]
MDLDKRKTDWFIVAGLPETVAGLLVAIGVAAFASSAFHRGSGQPAAPISLVQHEQTLPAAATPSAGDATASVDKDVVLDAQADVEAIDRGTQTAEGGLSTSVTADDESGRDQAAAVRSDLGGSAGVLVPAADEELPSADTSNEGRKGLLERIRARRRRSEGSNTAGPRGDDKGDNSNSAAAASSGNVAARTAGAADDGLLGSQDLSFDILLPWAKAISPDLEDPADTGKTGAVLPWLAQDARAGPPTTKAAPAVAEDRRPGRVLVPAALDAVQSQAFEALQVIEGDVSPAGICTRREYARWLVSASGVLSRSAAHKVHPAMYVEHLTEQAFEDISPEDPDFACIQGLAEAGLIPSRLLHADLGCNRDSTKMGCGGGSSRFRPDSPVTRQELVTWKVALENPRLPDPNKERVKELSPLVDVDNIDHDALPAVELDLASGENSIIASAFGLTRRLDPEKAVTKAQAALAISLGNAADVVMEELIRIQAERMAEEAVEEAEAAEKEYEQKLAAEQAPLLEEEKRRREEAERAAEAAEHELQRNQVELDREREAVAREREAVADEKGRLGRTRQEAEQKLAAAASREGELEEERRRLEEVLGQAEAVRAASLRAMTNAEAEARSLELARLRADEGAAKVVVLARKVEEARRKLEARGVDVGDLAAAELEEVKLLEPVAAAAGSPTSEDAGVMARILGMQAWLWGVLVRAWRSVVFTSREALRQAGGDVKRVAGKAREAGAHVGELAQRPRAAVSDAAAHASDALRKVANGARQRFSAGG